MLRAAPLYSEDFAGRREELALLLEEYRASCEGNVRFATVEGDAGIGKSRLLQELLKCAAPAATATGSCLEQIRSPYSPWIEILNAVGSPRTRRTRVEQKSAFFEGVAEAISRRCTRGPLIVALEDLQWADGATLELLGFLLARLAKVRLLVLITMRPDSSPAFPALAAFRSAVSRKRCTSVHLGPLRRNDVRNLVQNMLGRRGHRLPAQTVSQIEILAEGNPLFAEELARAAVESGELTLEPHVPLSITALLSERLSLFDEVQRNLLVRASILGDVFDLQMLTSITGATEEEATALMQRCVERGLIVEDTGIPFRFRFKHALIRKALADTLVLALAAPLHVRIANALEALDDQARAAELAYHWSAARSAEKARLWNERAGAQASEVYAYRDAIRFYGEALRWSYPPGPDRARVFECLGTLHYIDGTADEPAVYFDRCRAEYEGCGDANGAARAVWLLADQYWVDGRTVEAAEAAAEATARARRCRNAELESWALLSSARFAITLGKPQEASAYLRKAARFESLFDKATLASLHEIRGETHAILGCTRKAVTDLLHAADLAAATGSPELIAQIENNVALGAADLGELDLALLRHRRALDEADRTGMMWRSAYCSLGFARTLMLKGELQAAVRLVWSALETGVTTPTFVTKAAAVGIPIALMLNDLSLLEACAREDALDLAWRSGEIQRIASVSAAFAELRAEQGDAEEARQLLGRALERVTHAHRAWDLIIAATRFGDRNDLAAAEDLLTNAFGRPRIRRAYALLFRALTSPPGRSERFAIAALAHFRATGDVLHEAQSLELSGRRDDAAALYRKIGSVRDVQRLKGPAAENARRDLSPRQQQIADLVARGETNRAIAAELRISEHTVEHHISAIFERLGLKSRAQLAHAVGLKERPL